MSCLYNVEATQFPCNNPNKLSTQYSDPFCGCLFNGIRRLSWRGNSHSLHYAFWYQIVSQRLEQQKPVTEAKIGIPLLLFIPHLFSELLCCNYGKKAACIESWILFLMTLWFNPYFLILCVNLIVCF